MDPGEEQELPNQGEEELHVQIKRKQVLLKVKQQQIQKYSFVPLPTLLNFKGIIFFPANKF